VFFKRRGCGGNMSFTLELLKQNIQPYLNSSCIWIAYSGGCDSHVLLYSLAQLREELNINLKAIHINHGLSPLANEWEEHCREICEQLSISYLAISVNANQNRTSPEEAARIARYKEWKKLINKNEVLLLAHHQDDQAETVLLQLLRGSGVKGLAAMPAKQDFSQGRLCRPLLGYQRQELHSYAVDHNLNWIDDPSNFDTDFDRNFLRHDVIPLLESRWPALKRTLSRNASHQAEADQLLSELAFQDWHHVHLDNKIIVSSLLKLSEQRQRNVLRYWLSDICELSLPDTIHLKRIMEEVITAAEDAKPEVIWRGGEVRRYQGFLYGIKNLPQSPENKVLLWRDLSQSLELGDASCLSSKVIMGQGLSQKKLQNSEISIRFRQGGEMCKPVGRGQTHQLKKLFQEWQVPPWQRAFVPLVYVNDELAQAVGYCLSEKYAASSNEAGWLIGKTSI